MRWLVISTVCALIPMVGCITIPGNQLSDSSPVPQSPPPPVEQTVGDFSFHLDGGKMVTSNKMGRAVNDEILGRWRRTGFIHSHTYVKSSLFTDAARFRVTLGGHMEGESSILLQIVSGLTLTVIPYSVVSHLDLRYSVENAETGCRFEAHASDSYRTVVGLLLIPATPFAQGGERRTLDRLAGHLASQLSEQGAFDPSTRCDAPGSLKSSPPENPAAPRSSAPAPPPG